MNKTTEALKLGDVEDLQDIVTKALKKAFRLGQTYWRQADSESRGQWKKADETQAKFYELEDETVAAIREALAEPDWYEEAMRLGGLNAKHVGELKQLRAEPVKHEVHQEPVGEMIDKNGYKGAAWYCEPPITGTKLYAAPVQPVKQEPVGKVLEGGYEVLLFKRLPEETPLYAAPVDAKAILEMRDKAFQSYVDQVKIDRELSVLQARLEALEEAAKVCEEQSRESGVAKYPFWNDCAAAIRGLK